MLWHCLIKCFQGQFTETTKTALNFVLLGCLPCRDCRASVILDMHVWLSCCSSVRLLSRASTAGNTSKNCAGSVGMDISTSASTAVVKFWIPLQSFSNASLACSPAFCSSLLASSASLKNSSSFCICAKRSLSLSDSSSLALSTSLSFSWRWWSSSMRLATSTSSFFVISSFWFSATSRQACKLVSSVLNLTCLSCNVSRLSLSSAESFSLNSSNSVVFFSNSALRALMVCFFTFCGFQSGF